MAAIQWLNKVDLGLDRIREAFSLSREGLQEALKLM